MSTSKGKKTVLITGCSSGIGEALAKEFHAKGYHVIATARRRESIVALGKMGISTVQLDVTNAKSIAAAKKELEAITGGTLDILVNNAGVSATQSLPLLDTSISVVTSMFATNIHGPMALASALGPNLVAAAAASSSSKAAAAPLVINISSLSSIVPFPFRGTYAMTKAALNSYSRTLAVELGPFGVEVMNVMAGYVSTKIGLPRDDTSARDVRGTLPKGSMYEPIADIALANKDAGLSSPEAKMKAEDFAAVVVAEVGKGKGWRLGPIKLGGRKEWLYVGTGALLVQSLMFLGEHFAGWMLSRMTDLATVDTRKLRKI